MSEQDKSPKKFPRVVWTDGDMRVVQTDPDRFVTEIRDKDLLGAARWDALVQRWDEARFPSARLAKALGELIVQREESGDEQARTLWRSRWTELLEAAELAVAALRVEHGDEPWLLRLRDAAEAIANAHDGPSAASLRLPLSSSQEELFEETEALFRSWERVAKGSLLEAPLARLKGVVASVRAGAQAEETQAEETRAGRIFEELCSAADDLIASWDRRAARPTPTSARLRAAAKEARSVLTTVPRRA